MGADSLFTTMAGLQAVDAQMQAVSSNLANVQTTGYVAVQAAAQSALYSGSNAPSGADAVVQPSNPDLSPGPLNQTGDPMDVAVGGDAWLQVQTPTGDALTRAGSLQITAAGMLADASGNPVLNTAGEPISLPSLGNISIGADGTISGVPAGQPATASQVFGQINLVATPAGMMTPLSGTLFAPPAGAALAPAADGSLHQGYLNGSNVDPTTTMMDLISDSRSYQMQTDMMKTQSSGSASLNTLLAQG
jgi:flagellar basal-body rod protein FlgF